MRCGVWVCGVGNSVLVLGRPLEVLEALPTG